MTTEKELIIEQALFDLQIKINKVWRIFYNIYEPYYDTEKKPLRKELIETGLLALQNKTNRLLNIFYTLKDDDFFIIKLLDIIADRIDEIEGNVEHLKNLIER